MRSTTILFGLLALASCSLARIMSVSAVNKNVNMGDTVVARLTTSTFQAGNGVDSANDMYAMWGYRLANSTCTQCIGVLVATDDLVEERRDLSNDGSFTVNLPAPGAPGKWTLTCAIVVIDGVELSGGRSTSDVQIERLTTHVTVNDPNAQAPDDAAPVTPAPSKHSHFSSKSKRSYLSSKSVRR